MSVAKRKPKLKPVCSHCGSEEVRSDAYAAWNVERQEWELVSIFDNTDCEKCEGECKLDWVPAIDWHKAGLWVVVGPDGEPITETAATTAYSARSAVLTLKNRPWSKLAKEGYFVEEYIPA